MKILGRDREQALVRLRVDSLDDLWHLRELVEVGDVATALTRRTAEVDQQDVARAGKAEKKPMRLSVRVESVEFAAFSNRLRLLGVIVEGPQDVGSHHTLNLEPNDDVTVHKPKGWRRHHEERLEEAIEASGKPLVTLVAIEENDAVVAVLRQYGVQKVADISGHVSGKQYAQVKGEEDSFFDEVLLALREHRPENAPLLVLGPGFAKERFLAYAREKQPAVVKGAAAEGTGQAGMTGVHEALRKGIVERVSKDQRVARESGLVERLFEAIAANKPATYGMRETERASEMGAVESILVVDHLVREGPGEKLLEKARATGAHGHVISTLHEAGRRLDALGGVGALLRYPLE